LKNMTGMGGVMVHFDVTWKARDAREATNVVVELRRSNNSPVPGTRHTIPRIASNGRASVHISAEGFADNERLRLVIDPETALRE
jgi:hypothetical protein